MILPHPHCCACRGSGVHDHLPCACRAEPGGCARCATREAGEERASMSRWASLDASVPLCDRCRIELGIAKPLTSMTPQELLTEVIRLRSLLYPDSPGVAASVACDIAQHAINVLPEGHAAGADLTDARMLLGSVARGLGASVQSDVWPERAAGRR